MNPFRNIALLVALSFLALASLSAQIKSDEVDIIKQFNARLADAERVLLSPKPLPVDTSKNVQQYNIVNRALNVQYLAPRISPKSLREEPQDPIYNGYARLGAGLPKALLFEGGYDLKSNENLDLGFDIRHLSMNNTGKVENQSFSDNDFGAHVAFHAEQGFSVAAKANYSRDLLSFYGYNELPGELSFGKEDVKQRYALLDGQFRFYNNQRTAGNIDYSVSADVYMLEDLYAARENGLNLTLGGVKWFDDKHPLAITLQTDFSTLRDTAKRALNNFFLTPSYTFHGDRFRVKAGLNIASSNDEFSVFPALEASANVVNNLITAFVGAEGSLQKNNFRNLSTFNPFLARFPDIRNTQYYHYYGGVKGEYRGVQYRAQLGYKDVQDLALYLGNGDTIPRFDVLYDAASIVTLSAELKTQLAGLEIGGRFQQNVYSMKNEEKPWHLPALTLNAHAAYTGLVDKLTLRSELFVQNGVPAKAPDGSTVNLNALLDLSFGASFQLSENIGAFANVNNVLNNRWQRWQYYPTFGLNALAGISARF